MHSAKCDAVIPGEEQLLGIPYREFVACRESAVNIHSLSSSTDLVVKLFQGTFNHVAYSMTGYFPNAMFLFLVNRLSSDYIVTCSQVLTAALSSILILPIQPSFICTFWRPHRFITERKISFLLFPAMFLALLS